MTYPDYTTQDPLVEELPSTVDLVVAWLKTRTRITDICGTRISSKRPVEGPDTPMPWLTVQRVIGITAVPQAAIDRARIQFNSWGGHKANGSPNWDPADRLIRALEAEIRGTFKARVNPPNSPPGEIMSTGLLEGIQQLEDPEDGGARFWMDAIIVARKV